MQHGLLKVCFLSLALTGLLLGMPGRMLQVDASTIAVWPVLQSEVTQCPFYQNMTQGSGFHHQGEGQMGDVPCYAYGGCAAYAMSPPPYPTLFFLPRSSRPVSALQNNGRLLMGPDPRPPDFYS